jgi:hypothetical protein
MPTTDHPNFSQIVSSSPSVQNAFRLHRPTRLWWRMILWLHGKPRDPVLSEADKIALLARGFHFYAWLYRGVGVLFLLLAPALLLVETYSAIASLFAGLYLWFVSGLGNKGADAYLESDSEAKITLVAFFVMIVAFLSLFVGTLSRIADELVLLPPFLNLPIASGLFVFGIGSYLIEIIFLVTCDGLKRVEIS